MLAPMLEEISQEVDLCIVCWDECSLVVVYAVVTSTLQFRSELRVLLVGKNELIVCDVMNVCGRGG